MQLEAWLSLGLATLLVQIVSALLAYKYMHHMLMDMFFLCLHSRRLNENVDTTARLVSIHSWQLDSHFSFHRCTSLSLFWDFTTN